jgi:hypothetical protein
MTTNLGPRCAQTAAPTASPTQCWTAMEQERLAREAIASQGRVQ